MYLVLFVVFQLETTNNETGPKSFVTPDCSIEMRNNWTLADSLISSNLVPIYVKKNYKEYNFVLIVGKLALPEKLQRHKWFQKQRYVISPGNFDCDESNQHLPFECNMNLGAPRWSITINGQIECPDTWLNLLCFALDYLGTHLELNHATFSSPVGKTSYWYDCSGFLHVFTLTEILLVCCFRKSFWFHNSGIHSHLKIFFDFLKNVPSFSTNAIFSSFK